MAKADHQAGIDPVALARFLVMPGIEPLLDAFGRIPPGPMRDSVIHLARTLADQYSGAPSEMRMPDPLLSAAGYVVTPSAQPAARISGPQAESGGRVPPNLEGPEAEVIRLRKKGVHPQEIQAQVGIPRAHVDRIIAEAKAAGIVFKNLRVAPTGQPQEKKVWHTSLDQLRGQGLSRVKAAADRRGITPEEYFKRRLTAVEMAMAGAQYPEIMAATGEDQKSISLYLSNARAAGIKVPYSEFTQERIGQGAQEAAGTVSAPKAQPTRENASGAPPSGAMAASNVIRPSRFFGPFSAVGSRQAPIIAKAAARRNMTPEAYLELQESIVRQRMSGVNPQQIAANTGADAIFVKDALQQGKARGAVYPPCPKGWTVRATG